MLKREDYPAASTVQDRDTSRGAAAEIAPEASLMRQRMLDEFEHSQGSPPINSPAGSS